MKPKHLLITLLALFASITASADLWTDENGTKWDFSTSGSYATITNSGYIAVWGTIPENLVVPSVVYSGETEYVVKSLGNGAFKDCSISSITIPSSVKEIGTSLCYSIGLNSIYFESNTPINLYLQLYTSGVFPAGVRIFVPDAAVDAYKEAWPDYAINIVPESSSTTIYDVTVTAQEDFSAVLEDLSIGEENAWKVVNLKVKGTFNSYDLMVFRNKMINLLNLDLSEANVIASSYKYYNTYNSKDNIVTGYFAPPQVVTLKLPKDITTLENYAFSGCTNLKTVDLPEGITSIPQHAFDNCSNLTSLIIPESVTSIGNYAFNNCKRLSSISFPRELKTIGTSGFYNCPFTEIRLPPYLESLGNSVFTSNLLNSVYAYMPDIIPMNTNTFTNYQTTNLYVPEFLYRKYYYDTNWSQFLNVNKTTLSPNDYTKVPTNSDITMGEDDQRIPDLSNGEHVDGEINTQGSFTVEGDEPQAFNEVEQILNGEGQGGSLIGEDNGETEGNLTVNTLRVKINVKAGRWYFFCFPFDVTIANCEYPGQYAWRYYDGAYRASNGSGGWKLVAGETLTALEGYAFQSSHAGNLIISFNHPTFGGDRPQTLVAHACENAANASWNFVGNPYSCFYDFQDDDITSPITVWNGTSYTAYRPGDDECHLQPYEAFFVQKPSGSSEINFEADRRETYRKSEEKKAGRMAARRARGIDPQRRLINLEILNGEEQADRTRVVLNQDAQHAYEIECDAAKFLSADAPAQLYSIENGIQMAINERPLEGEIRLGYTAKKAGTLSINAPRMDMPMMLLDTQLGITFDLSVGTYDFDTTAGTFNNRFVLCPSDETTGINAMTAKTGVCIGIQDGGISIGGAEGKAVNVYTTGGMQAAQHSGNGYIALKSGIYVVNVDGVTAKVSVK